MVDDHFPLISNSQVKSFRQYLNSSKKLNIFFVFKYIDLLHSLFNS